MAKKAVRAPREDTGRERRREIYFVDRKRYPSFKDSEAREFFRKMKKADPAAQPALEAEFILRNHGLVVWVANGFRWALGPAGCTFNDLVQEGQLGLIRAAQTYDPELGFEFSTYAKNWIWVGIDRSAGSRIAERGGIHIPHWLRANINAVRRAVNAFEQTHERQPTIDEVYATVLKIAKERDIKPLTMEETRKAFDELRRGRAQSLDDVNETGDAFMHEIVPSNNPDPEVIAAAQKQLEAINKVLSLAADVVVAQKGEHRASILNRRLGLAGHQPQSLEAAGSGDMTRQGVSQMLNTMAKHLEKQVGFTPDEFMLMSEMRDNLEEFLAAHVPP